MSNFTKKELEDVYNTSFTETDIEIINDRMIYDTIAELETETRYFASLDAYVDYAYLYDFQSAKYLINNIVHVIKNNQDVSVSSLLIDDSDDIALENNRYILVID